MVFKVTLGLMIVVLVGSIYVFGQPAMIGAGGFGAGIAFTAMLDAAVRQHIRREAAFLDEVRESEEDEEDEGPPARGGGRR